MRLFQSSLEFFDSLLQEGVPLIGLVQVTGRVSVSLFDMRPHAHTIRDWN